LLEIRVWERSLDQEADRTHALAPNDVDFVGECAGRSIRGVVTLQSDVDSVDRFQEVVDFEPSHTPFQPCGGLLDWLDGCRELWFSWSMRTTTGASSGCLHWNFSDLSEAIIEKLEFASGDYSGEKASRSRAEGVLCRSASMQAFLGAGALKPSEGTRWPASAP
jgi:hypothetical protein